ncbi:MAG TPA: hypothetical protein VFV49_16160 [Thermoanaerobaculia bacterium]|nr:hypothetical protein [Thermoanaerobaculia bacterium]
MEDILVEPAPDGNRRDPRLASLSRRLNFAGDSWFFYDRLFCGKTLRRFARIGHSQTARIPDHVSRIGFDLIECLRTGSIVPDIGNPELALLDVDGVLPQHPRFRAYWDDAARNASVGMMIGIDMIRHGGKYYVLELNHGPSIYPRRRALYDLPFDPIVSGMVAAAKEQGFKRLVPIAFGWHQLYLDEFARAASELGIEIVPTNCPIERPGAARMVALPEPLEPETMYVIHSGLMTPLCRYVDNKWYTWRWLAQAIERVLPKNTKVALPQTQDSFFFPNEDHGERWPNLVIKLAGAARSTAVIAGRFRDEADARETLGLTAGINVPKQLRLGFVNSLLFYGRERVIYQSFIPPELDADHHPQIVRLHLLVSPRCTTFLSAHRRVSKTPLPERVPGGIITRDHTFVFNEAVYRLVEDEIEEELREVAAHLGQATQWAITQKFVTS